MHPNFFYADILFDDAVILPPAAYHSFFCPLYRYQSCNHFDNEVMYRNNPRKQSSWGQHGAHLGPVGPRWAPCWPHEPCYQGCYSDYFPLLEAVLIVIVMWQSMWQILPFPFIPLIIVLKESNVSLLKDSVHCNHWLVIRNKWRGWIWRGPFS